MSPRTMATSPDRGDVNSSRKNSIVLIPNITALSRECKIRIVVCVHQNFCCLCSCSLLFFSLPLIFTLLAASVSHLLTAALKLSFFCQRNSSLLFLITCSSSFSVIHVSVDMKQTRLCCSFFLSKSPGGRAISRQKNPRVAFRLPYLLIELCNIGMPVLWTDGRTLPHLPGVPHLYVNRP